jgi:PAS domain S-box-containing protein
VQNGSADQGPGLSRWERVLAGLTLIGCVLAIAHDGPWRWLALPGIGALFLLAVRSTRRHENHRRLVDLQLHQTGELLEMIGSSTDSIIWAKDRDGRMLYINAALERVAGIKLADVLGKRDAEWIPNPDQAEAFSAADRRVLETGIDDDCEEVFTGPDGQPRHYRSIRSPLRNSSGEVIGSVGVATDISEKREAEERERLLARELDHRAKNLLSVVQSVVALTKADTVPLFKEAVEGRIQSLGRAHSMLAASRWEGADLERVLIEELAPYGGDEQSRVRISGEPLLLKPAAAQSLALVIHELATNAVKYGSLSVPGGELNIRWEVVRSADRNALLILSWEESGGPPVMKRSHDSRGGFGSRLIRNSIERQLGGSLRLNWAKTGLVAVMEVALDRSIQPTGGASLGNPETEDPPAAPPTRRKAAA